jgi:adenosine deaminase
MFYAGMECLTDKQAFFEMTLAYLKRAHADSVRHAEIFFDPQPHIARGVSVEDQVSGMEAAFAKAGEEFGMTGALIFCWQRQLGLESARETLELMKPFVGRVVGVGCDSDYAKDWPTQFAGLFREARAAGFKICGHAGECPSFPEGGAPAMQKFIDDVGPDRLDHGFCCWYDESLLAEVIKRELHMTLCPLSNTQLSNVPAMAEHPIKLLLEAGASVGINSDDPAYLGGFIGANYQACMEACGMTAAQLCACSRWAVRGCWAPEVRKAELLAEIDAFEMQLA